MRRTSIWFLVTLLTIVSLSAAGKATEANRKLRVYLDPTSFPGAIGSCGLGQSITQGIPGALRCGVAITEEAPGPLLSGVAGLDSERNHLDLSPPRGLLGEFPVSSTGDVFVSLVFGTRVLETERVSPETNELLFEPTVETVRKHVAAVRGRLTNSVTHLIAATENPVTDAVLITTTLDGEFEIDNLAVGPVTLTFWRSGHEAGRLELDLPPGGLDLGTVDLELEEAAKIELRTVGENDQPIWARLEWRFEGDPLGSWRSPPVDLPDAVHVNGSHYFFPRPAPDLHAYFSGGRRWRPEEGVFQLQLPLRIVHIRARGGNAENPLRAEVHLDATVGLEQAVRLTLAPTDEDR